MTGVRLSEQPDPTPNYRRSVSRINPTTLSRNLRADCALMCDLFQLALEVLQSDGVGAEAHEGTRGGERQAQAVVRGAGTRECGAQGSAVPKTVELYRQQIAQGIDGDPCAALKARVILRDLVGKVRLVPGLREASRPSSINTPQHCCYGVPVHMVAGACLFPYLQGVLR